MGVAHCRHILMPVSIDQFQINPVGWEGILCTQRRNLLLVFFWNVLSDLALQLCIDFWLEIGGWDSSAKRALQFGLEKSTQTLEAKRVRAGKSAWLSHSSIADAAVSVEFLFFFVSGWNSGRLGRLLLELDLFVYLLFSFGWILSFLLLPMNVRNILLLGNLIICFDHGMKLV